MDYLDKTVSNQEFIHNELNSIYPTIIEPSAPLSLSVDILRSTSVTLSWQSPATANGIITQYELQYNVSSISSLVEFTDTLMGTVGGLSPGTNYTLKIRAYTRVGPGPFSDCISVTNLPECKLQ